jgi:hypothetical protein
MRLTLRTMLAYLDNVLEPAEAELLGKKIEESDFASGLVDRIKGVLKKLRMDAPKLDGKGMGNDANTVAEYLDSSLPQDHVGEFERVCLESDRHLCEVASCHQILTLVLGKPADVQVELRERIYALGDPTRAGIHEAGTAAAQAHATAEPPPAMNDNGRPAAKAAPLEVPDYLRAGRQPSVWPFVAAVAAALVLALIGMWGLGVFDGKNRLASLFPGRQPLAMNADEEGAGKPDSETGAAAAAKSGAAPEAGATTADVAAVTGNAAPAPSNESPAESAAPVAAAAVAPTASDRAATDSTDRVAIAAPVTPPFIPTIPETPDAVPPGPPPAAKAVVPKTPKAPVAVAPARPQPMEVGRYTSDRELLATLDPDDALWYPKQSQEVLVAGERLVVLPPYRPQISLPSAVQLTFAGEGALRMEEPDENNIPRATIQYGRFVAATAGKAGAQVELDLAGVKGVFTLVDADTKLAIKVIRWVPPGIDPESAEGITEIEMYNVNGRATWEQAEHSKVDLPMRHVHVYYGDDPTETHGPFLSPEWIDPKSVKPIERMAGDSLERLIDHERPLNLSLQEAMKDRRVEVRALASRCLAVLDDFEPILRELSDPNQYSYWTGEFDALRHAVGRSRETAGKIRETLSLLRAADAKDLYRMLWGYTEDQLKKESAAQLVKFLEHDQMDIRVLANANLVSITGAQGSFLPQKPPTQMKTAIQTWQVKQKAGAITYKGFPPSPMDVYRPATPPAGEPRPPGPPPR